MNPRRLFFDPWLALWTILASLVGGFFILDAGFPRAVGKGQSSFSGDFQKQVIAGVAAILLAMLVASRAPTFWQRRWRLVWWVTFALVALVPIIGKEQNGAQRWLGSGNFTLQPSEFAKFGVILLVAGWLTTRGTFELPERPVRTVGEFAKGVVGPWLRLIWPVPVIALTLLFIEHGNDMGTLLVVLAVTLITAWAGGAHKRGFTVLCVVLALGAGGLIASKPYRRDRIINHFSRFSADKVDDETFQGVRAEVDIATGGVTGVGVGAGRTKHVIPAPTTDYIMATVAEETGLLGALGVLGILSALVMRLLQLAGRTRDAFRALVLTGVAAWIGFQTAMNMCMVSGLIPTVGIPVPFVSYGGSSLIALWMGIGLCQSLLAGEPRRREVRRREGRRHRGRNGRTRLSGA